MAAQFTQISLDEMHKFINRGFHALHPKKGMDRGEVYYDLFLSPKAGVRVWTSVSSGGGLAAGVGSDAIRVQLYSYAKGRPLMPGKAPIVKRTQNWRDNLQERIEDLMEAYDSKEEQIESGAFIDWSK
jgi:hypothetical protein